MRVLMLGWEFPPFISGGLGTACYGLTKALSRQDIDVTFVLPKTVGSDYSSHVKLLSPQSPAANTAHTGQASATSPGRVSTPAAAVSSSFAINAPTRPGESPEAFAHVSFRAVPSRLSSPYPQEDTNVASRGYAGQGPISFLNPITSAAQQAAMLDSASHSGEAAGDSSASSTDLETVNHPDADHFRDRPAGSDYHGDLRVEAQRYAGLCVTLAEGESFDVIHAHDWLTFPAGMAVAQATGKPLVVHVHSTEFDRSGENPDSVVYDIERAGVNAAARVIAVSRRTRTILVKRYGLDESRVEVVYNGIENGPANPHVTIPPKIDKHDKIVLFLGRVTMQKGPEYFIQAAKRVLEKIDRVKFVIAGSGDKIQEMIEMAARADIGHKVVFTGFLRGADVERIFKMADLYVMPSVSEPFGIAPLEAISHDVPVIISKQSGVSEVLENALKVDFWDTDEMANKIIAVLRHPPLGATLREHAEIEVRRLTWDGAAERCVSVYHEAAGSAQPV